MSAFLSDGQAEQAARLLGSPENRWDLFVHTLAGLGLTDDKLYAALPALNPYAIGFSEATEEFSGSFNPRTKRMDYPAMLGKRKKLKEKLDAALEPYLSRKQFTAWKDQTDY